MGLTGVVCLGVRFGWFLDGFLGILDGFRVLWF